MRIRAAIKPQHRCDNQNLGDGCPAAREAILRCTAPIVDMHQIYDSNQLGSAENERQAGGSTTGGIIHAILYTSESIIAKNP